MIHWDSIFLSLLAVNLALMVRLTLAMVKLYREVNNAEVAKALAKIGNRHQPSEQQEAPVEEAGPGPWRWDRHTAKVNLARRQRMKEEAQRKQAEKELGA